jgi:putative transposase
MKRWRPVSGGIAEDRRPGVERVEQPHKHTKAEEVTILSACNQPKLRGYPPSQIVPSLAGKGIYLASESSFYRVLKKHQQQSHRGRMKPPRNMAEPTSFTATGPGQVWSWDISYCPSAIC